MIEISVRRVYTADRASRIATLNKAANSYKLQ